MIFWELLGKLKSLVNQSPLKSRNSVMARWWAIELWGDRQLPTTGLQFLNLESILQLKMVYVYFSANIFKMTSRTQDRYGKLTDI